MSPAVVAQDSMPEVSSFLPAGLPLVRKQAPLRLLAYVHLRNIHRSTGAGRVARQVVEHLAARPDVQLQVLADRADHHAVLGQVGEPWTGFKYQLYGRGTSLQQALWYLTERPTARHLWPEAEVTFCTAEAYVPPGRGALVVTMHDAAYFEQVAHRRDVAFWKQQAKWRLLFSRIAERADRIHTISEFSRDRLAHFFPDLARRIRVVPNGVTPHFFAPVSSGGLAYLQQEEFVNRRYVLIPGGLHFRKNADLILAAIPSLLSLFPDLLVCIVNHSDPVYAPQAEALGARVRRLGFVSDDALHALYAGAAAVWFPSRYEGFGLPVLEAMAAGAPVVTSNASSLPEVAGDAALLADVDSGAEHVNALEALLCSDALRTRLGAAGRARAAAYTWERAAGQLRSLFEEVR